MTRILKISLNTKLIQKPICAFYSFMIMKMRILLTGKNLCFAFNSVCVYILLAALETSKSTAHGNYLNGS